MDIDSLKVKKFCELTGWTPKAIEIKISRGVWINGREYIKAPDGNIVISIKGYESWIARSKPKLPHSFR
jgi:hypothetical protein